MPFRRFHTYASARLPGGGPAPLLGLLLVPLLLGAATLRPVHGVRALARARLALDGGHLLETRGDLALQRSLWDCGPTALHNLLVALGVPSPGPEPLARSSGTRVQGTTLEGLVRSAGSLGVGLRVRAPSPGELASLPAPYLAWLLEGHFVTVLAAGPDGRLTVHDPGLGAYRIPLRSFRRRWGGVVAHPEGPSVPPAGLESAARPEATPVSGTPSPSPRR